MARSSKIPSKDIRRVFEEIIGAAYNHITCINNEIQKLNIKDVDKASQDDKNKLSALTHTIILINDLIHPAHKISKIMFNKCESTIVDLCIKLQREALDKKLVDECSCSSCKEDNIKTEEAL